MKSISISSLAAVALLGASHVAAEYPAAALVYRQFKTLVYQGCYSSSTGLSKNDTYQFQSKGYCQQQCVPQDSPVQATSNSDECWCGDSVPPSSSKVDDSKCDGPCTGYGVEMCGGDGFFSVYLTGTSTDVPNAVTSGSSGTSGKGPKSSATTSAKPSVVTIGGQTVVVTAQPSGSSSDKASSGGPNKAAIAAGVVVGIVAIAAAAGGIFLFLRHRRRRAVEEEYRRNAAVSSFIGGGKPPTSSGGASSFTDTRLDPSVMAQRRMSDGSIADNQDYSRRILKVTNA